MLSKGDSITFLALSISIMIRFYLVKNHCLSIPRFNTRLVSSYYNQQGAALGSCGRILFTFHNLLVPKELIKLLSVFFFSSIWHSYCIGLKVMVLKSNLSCINL